MALREEEMAELYVFGKTAPQTAASGSWLGASGLVDGTQIFAGWQQKLINAGYGFHATIGAFSTPITGGGAGTIIDQDQPEGIISVPSGSAIMPVLFSVQCHVPLLATDADEAEILIAVDRLAAYAGDGTVATETAFNMRTDNPRSSVCTVASAATANITNPTLGIELAREAVTGDVQGVAATTMWTKLGLVYEPKYAPVIVGPAAVYVYWGGTVAVPGFAQLQWIELPASIDGLWKN